jgi:hypothetical protein
VSLFAVAELDPSSEVTDELRAVLAEHARLFLIGGGRLSLADWTALSLVERAAFVAAGRLLAVRQAVRIGEASQGELAALRVEAEIDGGAAHDAAALGVAVRHLAREAKGVAGGR